MNRPKSTDVFDTFWKRQRSVGFFNHEQLSRYLCKKTSSTHSTSPKWHKLCKLKNLTCYHQGRILAFTWMRDYDHAMNIESVWVVRFENESWVLWSTFSLEIWEWIPCAWVSILSSDLRMNPACLGQHFTLDRTGEQADESAQVWTHVTWKLVAKILTLFNYVYFQLSPESAYYPHGREIIYMTDL